MAKTQNVCKYRLEHFIPLRILCNVLGFSRCSLGPINLQLGLFSKSSGIDIFGSTLPLIYVSGARNHKHPRSTHRFRISVVPRKMESKKLIPFSF